MKKEVSIVLSRERKNHRKLAQEWFGLTDEQMVGMDVHHNPPRHQGGRNIPEHLFVYHETLHAAIHEDLFVLSARKGGFAGGRKGGLSLHQEKDEEGKSIYAKQLGRAAHKDKDETGKSLHNLRLNTILHANKNPEGKSAIALKAAAATHKVKDNEGKSKAAVKAGKTTSSQKWEDPRHPELGQKAPSILVMMQKRRGLPHGPENRRRVK